MVTRPHDAPVEPPRPRVPRPLPLTALAGTLGAQIHLPAGAASSDAAMAGAAGSDAVTVRGTTLDSRSVEPGDLWCALPGANTHGARFAAQARDLGAAAALTDPAGLDPCLAAGLPTLVVPDPRLLTAPAAAEIAGRPGERLTTVGITGTNGKTSVTTMLTTVLESLGTSAGLIGTSGTRYRDAAGAEHRIATLRTTPEAPEIHGILARMVEDGVQLASLEVSSHALVLHRADQVVFDVACFTNLSQDHLDFHGTMEKYFRAKRMLFTPEHSRRGIVCVDDEWGRRLAAEASVPVTTYATRPGIQADHLAQDLEAEGFGTRFTLRSGEQERSVRTALPGRHYVANTVAVLLLLDALGLRGPEIDRAVGEVAAVPGRMESVTEGPVRGVVDYSHTADALEQALLTLRDVPGTRRILVVTGAGGDRDRSKRPVMGETAARLADVVIVTDDNPRTEDPAVIRREVLDGIPAHSTTEVHESAGRGEAIALAARLAEVGDTILVAGKGAETGQEISGIVHPFDDRLRLRDALHAHPAAEAPEADGGL
jgi:UDP-N-acetylmuramoyl-L-alanyl-D-glutamate--2,6-diaminopimelate ligase